MSSDFNRMNIEIKSMDGGTLVTAQLTLAESDGLTSVDQRQEIIAGKPGTSVLNSRVRKAVKRLMEGAFPRPPKVEDADAPGQQRLALGASS